MLIAFLASILARFSIFDFILGTFSPNIQNVLMNFLVKLISPIL